MKLREMLSQYWLCIQGNLFPWMEECLGDLSKKQQQLTMRAMESEAMASIPRKASIL